MNLKDKIFGINNFEFNKTINEIEYDGVYVSYNGNEATIGYTTKVQKARCYFLLSMKITKGETNFEIKEKPVFETCGPMLDMSRGGVTKKDAVKDYIDKMAALGLNMLMLYTEDTYELEGYPFFGYMRGGYTIDELKEIDDYAYEMGVEVIPCIQTLGHLGQYLKWRDTAPYRENNNALLPDEEKTYEFIEAEIKTMRTAFRSNRIHLGMDEVVGLGHGQFFEKHGLEPKLDIFNRHLKRVLGIAEKYDFESIIWADMYFSAENDRYYGVEDAVVPQYAIDSAPTNVELCFWHYYDREYSYYHKKFVQYERFQNPVSFGGGVWTWDGFVPYFGFTLDTMLPALKACVDHNVKNVYATMWGNGGCETDYFKAFDGLAVFSEYCYKGTECTVDDIYDAAGYITNADRKFIDTLSSLFLGFDGAAGIGKGLLYTDPLINLLHFDIDYNGIKDTYEQALVNLKEYEYHEDYRYYKYFITIALKKAEIIFNLQREYKADNKEYLLYVANELIPELKNDYNEFFNEFSAVWHKRYKVFGFEAIDNHFGGVNNRLTYASNVLNKYCSNELDSIDELEPEIIKGLQLTWRYAPSYMNSYLPY